MQSAGEAPPGGWEMEGSATDGLAVFMGFGVFIANDASKFSVDDRSWAAARRGYLCEGEILRALAAFLFLSGNSIDAACRHLKPHLGKRLRSISAEMSTRQGLQALAAL